MGRFYCFATTETLSALTLIVSQGGNFWTLENQAAALTKGSDTLQEVEIPPEHVPFVWALSNGTNVRDTGGTELPSSVLPAASGNGTSRIALEQIINATDRRPGNQRYSVAENRRKLVIATCTCVA